MHDPYNFVIFRILVFKEHKILQGLWILAYIQERKKKNVFQDKKEFPIRFYFKIFKCYFYVTSKW